MRVQCITITGFLAACGIGGLASAQTAVIDSRGLVTAAGTDAGEAILVSQVGEKIVVSVGANETSFAADEVQEVTIDARGGNDTITVNVNRPTTIRAGCRLSCRARPSRRNSGEKMTASVPRRSRTSST